MRPRAQQLVEAVHVAKSYSEHEPWSFHLFKGSGGQSNVFPYGDMLSRGVTIAEAAVELGLSVESARTYSKRIYAKTGARGQADLVRFVYRSALTIA